MSKHYNLQKVKEIASGDESFVTVIVDTFLEEIPPDLQSMQLAIESSNHKMAYQFAHKMKPNLDMFGIDLLREISAMEKWSDTHKSTVHIQRQLDRIVATLTAAIEELKVDFKK